jgi:hypothetical protein
MYKDNVTLLSDTQFVNADNYNVIFRDLINNINHIFTTINGNAQLYGLLFGNLLDYDDDGRKVLKNSGSLDTFRKVNSWISLSDFAISNDTYLSYDNNRMVYSATTIDATIPNTNWLEKDVFIPSGLRGQQLIFAIKCSGCTSGSDWTTSNAITEKIGITVVGADSEVKNFYNVGLSTNFSYYTDSTYTPQMTTVYVPFSVTNDTQSITIRILRTAAIGHLHVDKMYVGNVKLPTTTYDLYNVDINEIYDFTADQAKMGATDVVGHKIPDQTKTASFAVSAVNMNDVVTYDGLFRLMKQIGVGTVAMSSLPTPTVSTPTTTGSSMFFDYEVTQ